VAPDYTKPASERKLALSRERTLFALGTLELSLRPAGDPLSRSCRLRATQRAAGGCPVCRQEVPEPR
jgi:hypothetical protein